MIRFFRKYHRWIGIVVTLFVLSFSISGIILNHRALFSPFSLSRSFLPDNYHFENWNLASVKKVLPIGEDSCLFYGDAGIWLSDSSCTHFADFSNGFPKGIANKKISTVYQSSRQTLWAGTRFGLYRYDARSQVWESVDLPDDSPAVVSVIEKEDTLMVLSRSFLYTSVDRQNFEKHQLLNSKDLSPKVSLFKTLWELHSGGLFGIFGRLLVDLMSVIFIFLATSGLVLFVNPKLIKRKKHKNKDVRFLKKRFDWNLKWHNKLGWISFVFLIIITFTGMFLSPPLLIAIASSVVKPIPLTHLDSPNPWNDQLRTLHYNSESQTYVLGTSKGLFYTSDILRKPVKAFRQDIPISVMGITVFEQKSVNEYLVGSFEGLFLWNAETGHVFDYIKQKDYKKPTKRGIPIGDFLVSGYVPNYKGKEYFFDYRQGWSAIGGEKVEIAMPQAIQSQPISLWNLMLEIHTGRIFQSVLGFFYVLIVPLTGLLILFVLFSGWWIWYKRYRKH